MEQKDKELLLKDLSARLPYHTIVSTGEEDLELIKVDILNEKVYLFSESFLEFDIFEIKSYLRSMSSMTEEERKEYKHLVAFNGSPNGAANFVDWLNKKMFAYRTIDGKDMFELGLAIEAPKGMYE